MPAKKTTDLITRAETKADRRQRADRDTALTPRQPLDRRPPPQLTGDTARAVWQTTVAMYLSLDARIVSLLDQGLLVDYCITREQLVQIDELRRVAMITYAGAQAALDKVLSSTKAIDPKTITALNNSVNNSLEEILKLDARADRKRDLIHKYSQSLLLTPRSRGGVVPHEKPPKPVKSDMARIIDGESKDA